MDKYYLVNVRDDMNSIRIDMTVQPLVDGESIPDITYVYDKNDSDSDKQSIVFCKLKGFLTEQEGMEFIKSIESVPKKILLFYLFKCSFYKMIDDD